MKRILILYPGLAGRRHAYLAPHRWKLRLAGVRLFLADDRIEAEDASCFAGVLAMPRPEDVAAGWARLERYLETQRIDAILAQSEPSLFLAGLAARSLGLPGPSLAGTLATTSKWLSRRKLHAAGLPQPAFELVRDAAGARRFAEGGAGWPLVLKAVASTRQRLVTVVRDEAELEAAVARLKAGLPDSLDIRRLLSFCRLSGQELDCDPHDDFLVESFAAGSPLETEGLVQAGAVHSLGVLEQMQAEDDSFFIDGYLLPARRPALELERLEQLSRRALCALEVNDTGYSIEFRSGAAGSVLIEVNGRLGWDEGLGELFAATGGGLPAIHAARLALGKPLRDLRPRRCGAVAYHSQRAPGLVRRLPRARRRGRSIHSIEWHVQPGDAVLPISHPDSRPHLLHVIATDRGSSRAAYARARALADELGTQLISTPEGALRASAQDAPADASQDTPSVVRPVVGG